LRKGPELARKAIIFLFSLALHAVLVHVAFYAKITIKIYPVKKVVRNVYLAPSEKISLPENIGKFQESPGGVSLKRGAEYLGKESGIQAERGEAQNKVSGSGAGAGQPASAVGSKDSEEAGREEFYAGLASKFELGLASRQKTNLPPGYRLDLPARLGKIKDMSAEKKEGFIKDIDRLKYPYSSFSAIGSSGAAPSVGGYELRRGTRGARASFGVKGYDISPWAEKVVNKILLNWNIPSDQIKNLQGLVGISAVIERNGELSSVQIVSTSMVQALDEAALKALRMSSPFPQFPDDFPNKNIEAYFEFQYND